MDFGPIHERASTQRALITFDQLLDAGVSRHQVDRLSAQGFLVPIHRGVFRLPGSPLSWEQRVVAAALATAPDSWISGPRALAWWGVRDGPSVEVLTTSARRVRLEGVRAHQTIDLPGVDRRRHRDVPVTSIERSLFDSGRSLTHQQVGAALDHAVRDGLTTYERHQQRVEELGRRGRAGSATAQRVLTARGYGDGFGFEKAMRGLLREVGLPAPVRELKVHVDGFRYRVDFAYPDSMLGIECDSGEWHGLFHQVECDLERQNRIQKEGLLLMRYTVRRLRDERDAVGAEIVEAIARRAGSTPERPSVFPDVKPA